MMTLEEYVHKFVEDRLDEPVYAVLKDNGISLSIMDTLDINQWVTESVFQMQINTSQKLESARLSRHVQQIVRSLKHERFIMSSVIESEEGTARSTPRTWNYIISFRVRHRIRDSW